ncbi:MAG: DNA primase [Patescibacteria group bacterium]
MNQTEEIKKKIDIVDLISSYFTLQKAGFNYRGVCPFHKEKTPSFMVSPDKQIWYCFGCNQGGDVFSFVEKIEGIDFVGALKILADRAGVILTHNVPEKKVARDRFFEMNSLAMKFYEYILETSKEGQGAKDYLVSQRGIAPETIKTFHIGYSPVGPDILHSFLLKRGYTEEEMMQLGLVSRDSRGKVVDKMRERVIFPILSAQGKVVGFGGRIIREYTNTNFIPPKYLNSPQSPVYDKSSVLYGLDIARPYIREDDFVVVVEGYLDVIASHQAGIRSVVASSGTALSHEQLQLLSRYTKNIIFCFDSDDAGWQALKRALQTSLGHDIEVRAILLTTAKDPDELVKRDPKLWQDEIISAQPILELYYKNIIKTHDLSKMDQKKKASEDIMNLISQLKHEVERSYYVKKMSYDFDIPETTLRDTIAQLKTKPTTTRDPGVVTGNTSLADTEAKEIKLSRELLYLGSLIAMPEGGIFLETELADDLFTEEIAKNIYKYISEWHNSKKSNESIQVKSYLEEHITDHKIQETIALMCFLAQSFFEGLESDQITADIRALHLLVIQDKKERRKKDIQKEIYMCDKEKDRDMIKSLLRELQSLI